MGFVYHTHYLVWCEIARTDYIRAAGTSYADLEKAGLLLAVLDAEIRYEKAARYDNLVRIDCWVEHVQSRTVTFRYDVVRLEPGPELRLARAMTRLIALDRNGVPRTLPPELVERFRHAIDSAND
jgi:acyl-CoA thioester hydrolase